MHHKNDKLQQSLLKKSNTLQ